MIEHVRTQKCIIIIKIQYFADVNLGRVLLMGESFQDYS